MHSSPGPAPSLADHLIGLHLAALPTGALLKADDLFEEFGGLLRAPDDEGTVMRTEVEDDDRRHRLRDTGRHRRDRLRACMSGANSVRAFTALVIPVPFQTYAYQQMVAEAEAETTALPPVWWPEPEPAAMTLFLDEYVLVRPVGGHTLMARQLQYLHHLAEQGTARVLVLPGHAPVPAPGGPLYEIERPEGTLYADEDNIAVLYRVGPHAPALRACMDRYEQAALPPDESLRRLDEAITAMAQKHV